MTHINDSTAESRKSIGQIGQFRTVDGNVNFGKQHMVWGNGHSHNIIFRHCKHGMLSGNVIL